MASDVPALLADARNYTSSLVTQASAAMDEAVALVRSVGYVIPNYIPATLPQSPPQPTTLVAPTLDTVNMELPEEPDDVLTFREIGDIEPGALPELTALPPTITLPSQPSQVAEFLTTVPGLDTDIEFPEPPPELMGATITAPEMSTYVTPIKPTISLPGFEAVAPTLGVEAPTDYEERFAAAYRDNIGTSRALLDGYVDAEIVKLNPQFHTQMAAIEAQLTRYLAGGTGLDAAAENAIYERARGKNDAEGRRTQDAAWATAAQRGFTLPDGALFSALQQARQGAADNNAKQANEIVVMQAEMEQKNLQFAVTTSASLRTSMVNAAMTYFSSLVTLNGQALEYGKTILNAIIEVYNSAVRAFSAKLDAYRAETVVYETRVKAAMSYIELYQAEINSLNALITADRSKVEIYRARIEALTSYANIYRAQIEAVQGRVNLEKLQIEVFQAQVEAYRSQVNAKTAEWQGYSAAIAGQESKAKIFNTQVDAYNAQVNAYKAGIEAKAEAIRAQATVNQARASNYAAKIQGYSAVVNARGEKVRITLENQRQALLSYQARVQAELGNANLQNDWYKTVAQIALTNAQNQMTAQTLTVNSVRDFGNIMATLGTANANIFAASGQAALAGMNTLANSTLSSSA